MENNINETNNENTEGVQSTETSTETVKPTVEESTENVSTAGGITGDTTGGETPKETPKKKKTGIIIAVAIIIVLLVGFAVSTSETTYTSEMTYMEISEDDLLSDLSGTDPEEFTTEKAGTYLVGTSPAGLSLISTSTEEIILDEDGYYVAGTDFPSGTYDIELIEGDGLVMSDTGVMLFMSEEDEDVFVTGYDNMTLIDGYGLTLTESSIKLIPQTDDYEILNAGTYTVNVTDGVGSLFIMNEADMQTYALAANPDAYNEEGSDIEYVDTIEITINNGDMVMNSGVVLDFIPVEGQTEDDSDLTIGEKSLKENGYVDEKYTISSEEGAVPVCYQNDTEVDCEELYTLPELEADIQAQMNGEVEEKEE